MAKDAFSESVAGVLLVLTATVAGRTEQFAVPRLALFAFDHRMMDTVRAPLKFRFRAYVLTAHGLFVERDVDLAA